MASWEQALLIDLLSRKLAQCGVMFDFLDCVADLKGKEVKRAALNELVECVGSTRGVLIEPVYPDIIRMVSTWHPASGEGFGGTGTLLTCPQVPVWRIKPPLFSLASGPTSSFPPPHQPPCCPARASIGHSVSPGPVPARTLLMLSRGLACTPPISFIAMAWPTCCLLHEASLNAQARNLPFAA